MSLIKRTAVLAAAVAFVSVAQAQNTQPPATPSQTTNAPAMSGAMTPSGAVQAPRWPAGFTSKPAKEKDDIYNTIASATEAALTKGGFDDLVERLTDPDRNRIGRDNFASKDFPELTQRIDQLRTKFREKYNADFDIDDVERVFDARVVVAQAEVTDAAVIGNRFPFTDSSIQARTTADDTARPAAGRTDTGVLGIGNDANYLSKGREVAVVVLPGAQAMQAPVNISLAEEALDRWKIDVPDSISGQQLHDNLVKHLDLLNGDSANWPANAQDAKRIFSHHIMAALYGQNLTGAGRLDMSTPGSNQNMNRDTNINTQNRPGGASNTPNSGGTPTPRP